MVLVVDGKEETVTVCGIYANLFNGGKTAKATFDDTTAPTIWTDISIKLKHPEIVPKKLEQYKRDLPFAKMNNAEKFRDQTFGATIQSLFFVSIGALAVALLVTSLITTLFIKLLLAKDKREIAILKATGFTNQAIGKQYLSRSLITLLRSRTWHALRDDGRHGDVRFCFRLAGRCHYPTYGERIDLPRLSVTDADGHNGHNKNSHGTRRKNQPC